MDVPLVKPRWLFPITFSFVHLEMASSSICSVVFPGAEIRPAGRSSLDPPSWRWEWHLSLPVLGNHCQAPGPCKNGRAWPHNDITSSLSALRSGVAYPVPWTCAVFIWFAVICPVKWSVSHLSSMVDIPSLLQTLPLDAGTWEVWQQTLQVKDWGKSDVECLQAFLCPLTLSCISHDTKQ